jgi:hypothetical protein
MIAKIALTCDLNSETWVSTLPNRFKISSTSPPVLASAALAFTIAKFVH